MVKVNTDGGHIDEEDLGEQLGLLVDKAENFLMLGENDFMTGIMRIDALKTGLREIRDELKELCIQIKGENPWEN